MATSSARARARQLWDAAEFNGLDFESSVGALRLDSLGVAGEHDARPLSASTSSPTDVPSTTTRAPLAPTSDLQASAASRLATERTRLRELESARRKNHVGRRKERRGLNVALLGHGLGALLEDGSGDEDSSPPFHPEVNTWRSTFPIPLSAPVIRLLEDRSGGSAPASSASTSKRQGGPHSMALGRATAILASASLRMSDLPPTRDNWRLTPQAARAWTTPRPGRQSEPSPTALVGLNESDEFHAILRAEVSDYGPLQMGVIQMALDISGWADLLDARGRGPAYAVHPHGPADDPDATLQVQSSPPTDLASLCSVRDEASSYTEILRTPSYLIWRVPDAFGRLLVHALARVYDCGSFSAELPGLVAGETAPTRCTFITHPHRRLPGRRQEVVSHVRHGLHASSPTRRHASRRRAHSATSAASSARLTAPSVARASSRSRSPGTSVTSNTSVLSASEDEQRWEDDDELESDGDDGDEGHRIAPPRLANQLPRARQRSAHSTESDASGAESLEASDPEEM